MRERIEKLNNKLNEANRENKKLEDIISNYEIKEMIEEGKEVELNCHFCNTNYTFTVEELKEILHKAKA